MRTGGWTALAAAATAIQLFAVYRPSGPPTELSLPGLDKVVHLVIFAAPVVLILLALAATDRGLTRTGLAVTVGAFAAHAVISELIQGRFLGERSGDPADVLADLLGIGLGAVIGRLVAS